MEDKKLIEKIRERVRKDFIKKNKKGFYPCPNRAWHTLGTTCDICGLKD